MNPEPHGLDRPKNPLIFTRYDPTDMTQHFSFDDFYAKWGTGSMADSLKERHGAQLHDAAVATAYGWADYTPDMPDMTILQRLLALNVALSGAELTAKSPAKLLKKSKTDSKRQFRGIFWL